MRWTVAVLIIAFASGCAVVDVSGSKTLADTRQYRVVTAERAMSLTQLADEALGASDLASRIAEINGLQPEATLDQGQWVVIPKRPGNPSFVSVDGVQTLQILCYHRFSQGPSNDPLVVSKANFQAQLQYLADNGYRVLSLAEVDDFLSGDRLLPEKLVVLTIDDGYRSVADIAVPLLKQFGFTATLFVYPEFVGGGHALSWEALRALQSTGVIDVQSHSNSHASHSRQSDETDEAYQARLIQEVSRSSSLIRKHLGRKPTHYAYPYGDTSAEAIAEVSKRGYTLAGTVQRGSNPSYSAPLTLRRTMIYGQDNLATFERRLVTFQRLNLK